MRLFATVAESVLEPLGDHLCPDDVSVHVCVSGTDPFAVSDVSPPYPCRWPFVSEDLPRGLFVVAASTADR